MRTFIAIELEEEVKDALEGAQQQAAELCRKGNYTPKENFHLTLHFLGESGPGRSRRCGTGHDGNHQTESPL